jgi:hypothetical protein
MEEAIPMDAQMSDDADEPLRSRLARAGMYVALLAAWVATAGSLYMSEVLGWIPACGAGISGSPCIRWPCCWPPA